MKKLSIILTVILISNSIFAQTAAGTSGQTAKVYFLRSDGFPHPTSYNVFIDDILVCKVNNKRYSIHNVAPGSHTITSQVIGGTVGKKADRDKKDMEAGKTYYIQLHYKKGFFATKLKTKEIGEEAAKKIIAASREIKNCK